MTREQVMVALFNQLVTGGPYLMSGRRLIPFAQVTSQPALFLRHTEDETLPRRTGMPGKVVVGAEAWIYSNSGADPDISPETALNNLIDGADQALQPAPGREAQTLGGLVIHAWIEGKTDIYPGDLAGQALAIIPIKMLVPTFHGPLG